MTGMEAANAIAGSLVAPVIPLKGNHCKLIDVFFCSCIGACVHMCALSFSCAHTLPLSHARTLSPQPSPSLPLACSYSHLLFPSRLLFHVKSEASHSLHVKVPLDLLDWRQHVKRENVKREHVEREHVKTTLREHVKREQKRRESTSRESRGEEKARQDV